MSMESNLSRSSERADRVRLDDVVVEFSTGTADDCFEADAINVAAGGIALRSPILPEVGTRLSCRFANPLDGEQIRAECEVVWASDHGPNLGEFGLRFERLSAESAESLRRLVDEDDRMLTSDEAAELGWSAPPALDADDDVIALRLDGVGSELLAEVKHDSDDALVAEQELPFLRLGTKVTTEDGRTGVLQTVELRIDGSMPRLVFTIVYDQEAAAAVPPDFDDADEPSDEEASGDESSDVVDDDDFGTKLPAPASPRLGLADGLDDDDDFDDALPAHDEHDTIPDDVRSPVVIHQARPRISEQVRAVGEPVVGRATEVAEAVRDATVDRLSAAIPAVRSRIENARESVATVAADVGPKVADGVREFAAHASRFAKLLSAKLRDEQPAAEQAHKRVQRRPGERGQTVAAQTGDRTFRGRHALIGVLGLTVAVLAIRGISVATSSDETVAPPASIAPAAPDEAITPTDTIAPAAVAPAPVPVEAPPVAVGGPIPEPTYPSLDRATSEPAAAEAPAARPRLDFGASTVPGATPFELRMTTPIDRIEGESTESGFTVRIFRSNSLSRAGPIAQQHPAVDRAAVENNGENAVLTIGWKPGRRPPYRVEAVGNRLRILLGR